MEKSGIRVVVSECCVADFRRWRPLYQTVKSVRVNAKPDVMCLLCFVLRDCSFAKQARLGEIFAVARSLPWAALLNIGIHLYSQNFIAD